MFFYPCKRIQSFMFTSEGQRKKTEKEQSKLNPTHVMSCGIVIGADSGMLIKVTEIIKIHLYFKR